MKISIAQNIRFYRRRNDWTQEEFAAKLCVSVQVVSRWETGVTYPDLELIPVISNLFGITTDQLIGAVNSGSGEAPQELYDELNTTTDPVKRLNLLKEVHRDYPNDNSFLFYLCLETEDIADKRKYVEELLSNCEKKDQAYRSIVINDLVCCETDEIELDRFLEKYTATEDTERSFLMSNRYLTKGEFNKYEPLKQMILLKAINNRVFPNLLPDYPPKMDVKNSLFAAKTRLEIINVLTETNGKSVVSGDGIPDCWFGLRLYYGIRYICYLSGSGLVEDAIGSLEELTDLCEAFFSQKDGILLSFRCPALSALDGKLNICFKNGPEVKEDYLKTKYIVYLINVVANNGENMDIDIGCPYLTMIWPHLAFAPLIEEKGWQWFDGIRNNPRYIKCVEKLMKWAKKQEC